MFSSLTSILFYNYSEFNLLRYFLPISFVQAILFFRLIIYSTDLTDLLGFS